MKTRLAFLPVVIALAGCGPRPDVATPEGSARRQIYATTYPLAFVAERLAGDLADVVFPAPADEDPAFWNPPDDILRRYQRADLILINGAGAEKWVEHASLPPSRIVNASAAFTNEYLMFTEMTTHSHGPQGAHSHGLVDFNTWLDPVLLARESEAVEEAMIRILPAAAADIQKRGTALRAELAKFDEQLRESAAKVGATSIFASHPVYAYLARRCGWDLHAMHWEPGEDVPPEQWAAFDQLRKAHPGRIMLWEDEPLPAVRAALEQRGIRPVIFAPCGNRPARGDYLEACGRNLAALRSGLAAASATPGNPSP
ncbi:MAG: metal ABC transporter substrate-binding protein [Kiritimatiellia bacterium]